MSRDPAEGLSARQRALMACLGIPPEIQKWMIESGAVEPLLDNIEKTILAAERAAREEERERCAKITEGWLEQFAERTPQYVSAQKWACDAVRDIAAAIRQERGE
jgi:hypothetical protein